MKSMEGKASVVQMSRLTSYKQENLMSFVKQKLEMADDFMEDATVYFQLRRFFFAMESLQKATRALDVTEQYFCYITEAGNLLRHQSNIIAARERVRRLEQSLPN